MLDLDYQTPRGTTPPTLPMRDGLGAARERPHLIEPERIAWREAFYFGMLVVDTTTEFRSSRVIHQPFRAVDMTIQRSGIAASALDVAIFAAQTDLTGVTLADLIRHGLITGAFEGNQGDNQRYNLNPNYITLGGVVRAVPTRLHVVSLNGSGGDVTLFVTIAVEYLAPIHNPKGHHHDRDDDHASD